MATKTATKAKIRSRTDVDDTSGQWTQEEIDAMRDHVQELKAAKRRGKGEKADGAADLRAKLDGLTGLDRKLGERINEIVTEATPELEPRTYYGMPAWSKDGKLICFFQPASKFKVRYATLGFEVHANLDDGDMFPTSWAVTKMTPAVEAQIAKLLKKAVS